MFAEGTTSGITRRPDLDSHHGSADGVDDLLRNALRFLGARLRFFKAGVKLPQSRLGSPRFAAASGRGKITDPTKGKGQSDFSDWPLFMPATTCAPTRVARAPPPANAVRLEIQRPPHIPESTTLRCLFVTDRNCTFNYAARSWRAWAPALHDAWQRFAPCQIPISPTASAFAEGRRRSLCDLLHRWPTRPVLHSTRPGP